MTIRVIQPEETWPVRQTVMWADKPLEFIKIRDDFKGTHYGLFKDGKLTSVISCFETDGEMQFRKFATLTDEQGQGLGSYLLSYILDLAREKGVRRVWCNARVDKTKFYEKFGLKKTKETFFKEGKSFIIMECIFD